MGSTPSSRRLGRWAAAVALALLAAACDYTVGTATGQLDPTFGGGDGYSALDGLRVRTVERVTGAARLPDGRVVTVGTAGYGAAVLVRSLPDGSLDPSFGDGGVAPVPGWLDPMGDIAVTPDGHVLVPGRWAPNAVWAVARLRPDGSPDPAFGTGGVAVLAVAGASGLNWPLGVVADGDRTYLLAFSWTPEDVTRQTLLLGLGADGTLDPTFGTDGTGIVRVGGGDTGAVDVAPDGTIVVGWSLRDWSVPTQAGLTAVDRTGTVGAALDLATVPTATPLKVVDDLDVGADGSVAVTVSDDYGTPTRYAVRATPDLAVDPSFGAGGIVDLGGLLPFDATEVAVDDDGGRVVVAGVGQASRVFGSAALRADGSLDPAWGDAGVATHANSSTAVTASGLFPTGDGFLIAGDTAASWDDPADRSLLALTPDGDPDSAFGDDGWVRTDLGAAASERLTAVATLPDGDLLVAGDTGDGIVAGRYRADGTPDQAHPPAAVLPDRLHGPGSVVDLTVADDGSAWLLVRHGDGVLDPEYGSGTFGWSVVALRPDGTADPTFGDGGEVVEGPSAIPRSIAVRPDGSILVSDLDVTPAVPPTRFTPYRPAEYRHRVLTLDDQGAEQHRTQLALTATPGDYSPGTMAVGPAGDAYLAAAGEFHHLDPTGTPVGTAALPAGMALSPAAVAVDGSGRVLVFGPGNVPGGAAADVVARFDASLVIDPAFGSGGATSLMAPASPAAPAAADVHVATDGSITTVHQGTGAGGSDLLVHRLLPSGAGDPAFSGDGRAGRRFRLGGTDAWVAASSVADGDIVVVGRQDAEASAFVARLNG